MAEFAFSKTLFGKKRRSPLTSSNIAYGLFVLFCFWAGAQMLSMLVHAPGVFEHLIQVQNTQHPRIEIGLAVGTIFGLVPFLIGCLLVALLGLFLRWRNNR